MKNKIECNKFDFVLPLYIYECIEAKKLLKFEPKHLIHTSTLTKKKLLKEFDIFGDSFTENSNPQQLKTLFNSISLNIHIPNPQNSNSIPGEHTLLSPFQKLLSSDNFKKKYSSDPFFLSFSQKMKIENKYFEKPPLLSFFRGFVFYIDEKL